jgi:hypothetical protein
MGIEEQIALRLQQGASPKDLLAAGFRKSTVYKVVEALRSHRAPAPSSLLVVQLQPERQRYLPGDVANLSFTLTNNSGADLYLFQTGIRPEWLGLDEWMPSTARKLLGAGDSMVVRIPIPIPPYLSLGEKELFFGVQGQWVGPQSASPSSELMWTTPLLLSVQRPPSGMKVFISHSVLDMALVSQLEATLDDNGIAATIADAVGPWPAIDQSDFFVALVTHESRLKALFGEIAHAHARGKQLILLRDLSLAALMPPELASLPWADVDFSAGDTSIVVQLVAVLSQTIETKLAARKKEQDDALGAIVLGLAALVAGIALARGKSN